MTELSTQLLLDTPALTVRDVVCNGGCRHKSAEECAQTTHMVFPYRGVYVRHVGRDDTVAEANQVLIFNEDEGYQISHPIQGGDACLSFQISEPVLRELSPEEQLRPGSALTFRHQRLRIDARTQTLVATLRHRLARKTADVLEAETLALTVLRRSLGEKTSHGPRGTQGRRKLVERAKLVLSSDLSRRWTLADIAAEVGVSPVYLTQVFQQVEGVPLYQYQLRLRLARALDLLSESEDLTSLGLQLGFSSHSHFSAAFKQAYGCTPTEFQRSIRLALSR